MNRRDFIKTAAIGGVTVGTLNVIGGMRNVGKSKVNPKVDKVYMVHDGALWTGRITPPKEYNERIAWQQRIAEADFFAVLALEEDQYCILKDRVGPSHCYVDKKELEKRITAVLEVSASLSS